MSALFEFLSIDKFIYFYYYHVYYIVCLLSVFCVDVHERLSGTNRAHRFDNKWLNPWMSCVFVAGNGGGAGSLLAYFYCCTISAHVEPDCVSYRIDVPVQKNSASRTYHRA